MKCWNCWTSIATRSHPHLSGQAPHHLPPAPSSPFSLLPLLFCMLHPARTPAAAAAAALYCRLPLGAAQLLHFISVSQPPPTAPLLFFQWVACFCHVPCLSVFMFVCVCESRFCVQVRSFNFDLCFRLFCVAFVDFCHLNRNFYFPHVSRHAQTPQQQQEQEQPSPVFVLPVLFFSALFLWTHVLRGALATGNWRARLANWISFLPDEHLKLTSSQPGLVRVWVVWPALLLLLLLATHAIIRAEI